VQRANGHTARNYKEIVVCGFLKKKRRRKKYLRRLFGWHLWKDGPRAITEWKEAKHFHGCRLLGERLETPEEYHARKKNMVTLLIFGATVTFKLPFRK
jgi:hypothetical protein